MWNRTDNRVQSANYIFTSYFDEADELVRNVNA